MSEEWAKIDGYIYKVRSRAIEVYPPPFSGIVSSKAEKTADREERTYRKEMQERG